MFKSKNSQTFFLQIKKFLIFQNSVKKFPTFFSSQKVHKPSRIKSKDSQLFFFLVKKFPSLSTIPSLFFFKLKNSQYSRIFHDPMKLFSKAYISGQCHVTPIRTLWKVNSENPVKFRNSQTKFRSTFWNSRLQFRKEQKGEESEKEKQRSFVFFFAGSWLIKPTFGSQHLAYCPNLPNRIRQKSSKVRF